MCQRIQQFNARNEMVESIGKYVAYWSDVNAFHNLNEFDVIKQELAQLGLEQIISEIEQNIESNKYQDYIEYRNKILEEYTQQTMKQLNELSKTTLSSDSQGPKL